MIIRHVFILFASNRINSTKLRVIPTKLPLKGWWRKRCWKIPSIQEMPIFWVWFSTYFIFWRFLFFLPIVLTFIIESLASYQVCLDKQNLVWNWFPNFQLDFATRPQWLYFTYFKKYNEYYWLINPLTRILTTFLIRTNACANPDDK